VTPHQLVAYFVSPDQYTLNVCASTNPLINSPAWLCCAATMVEEIESTLTQHITPGTYCKACKSIPWEPLMREVHMKYQQKLDASELKGNDLQTIDATHKLHLNINSFMAAVESEQCLLCSQLWKRCHRYDRGYLQEMFLYVELGLNCRGKKPTESMSTWSPIMC